MILNFQPCARASAEYYEIFEFSTVFKLDGKRWLDYNAHTRLVIKTRCRASPLELTRRFLITSSVDARVFLCCFLWYTFHVSRLDGRKARTATDFESGEALARTRLRHSALRGGVLFTKGIA